MVSYAFCLETKRFDQHVLSYNPTFFNLDFMAEKGKLIYSIMLFIYEIHTFKEFYNRKGSL